jgi:hypothetical protein
MDVQAMATKFSVGSGVIQAASHRIFTYLDTKANVVIKKLLDHPKEKPWGRGGP